MKHLQQVFITCPLSAMLLAGFLFAASMAQGQDAAPSLQSFVQYCAESASAPPAAAGGDRVLFLSADGEMPELQEALPEEMRAVAYSSVGALACVTELETELENCHFGIFFSLPRVRRDYRVTVHALESANELSATVIGGAPPACHEAGTLHGGTRFIGGDPPTGEAVVAALHELGINALDPDDDGYSNLEEFISGSDPADASSPGASISVTLNGLAELRVSEGEAIAIAISLNPGARLGEEAAYYLYLDSYSGLFSYIHPGQFEAVESKTASARGKALRFKNLDIFTLPAMGVGEYQVIFEVEFDSGAAQSSRAGLSIVPNAWQFTEVSRYAGFDYSHGYAVVATGSSRDRQRLAAGVAAGDYDNDGWVDLYAVRGTIGENLLFRNLGNGRFEEVGARAGVNLSGRQDSGAIFADYDGDGWLDLLLTGMNSTPIVLLRNAGDGSFEDVTASSGIDSKRLSMGASFADYDKDGDLDLWINRWLFANEGGFLWRNDGAGSFTHVSEQAGIPSARHADFTTNFADIDNDGWLDLLIAADYHTSQVFINNRNGTFRLATTEVISDENGMGGAVGDYDNDGDLDWFVSSIYDYAGPRDDVPWGASGNRFYQNQGDGTFADVTHVTGTRIGFWGWGACFADFNNDGHLDLFHVNGYTVSGDSRVLLFEQDPSRLFISNRDGTFRERSAELGIVDYRQGRGIVCFDYDRDGDVDIFIANHQQPPLLFRNDLDDASNYLHIQVEGELKNSEGIGARIYARVNGTTQMRELRAGSNYLSQNPVEAYFGLGNASAVEEVRVVWPSGQEKTLRDVEVNQLLFISRP